MKGTPLAELAARMDAVIEGVAPETLATGFATDSREVSPGDVFIAIKGERTDGHEHVDGAYSKGAVAALVEREVEGPYLMDGSVETALANLASSYRTDFTGPVVGVTGSSGKTSVKEFVAAALSPLGEVLKTQGNRNTEWTSPLVWADLEPQHRAAVIEMSMRGRGQVEHLAAFSRPTIGIVTNIGYAHIELLGSREGIARAKGELLQALPSSGTAILWHEDELLDLLYSLCPCAVRTFGVKPGADAQVTGYEALSWSQSRVEITIGGESYRALLPAIGRHMALNAAAALMAAEAAGVNLSEAAEALNDATLPPMRMEVREWQGARVLLDTYNASPPAVIAALETLTDLPCEGRRLAVLGEMRELGEYAEAGHREVGRALAHAGLDQVCIYGPSTKWVAEEAAKHGYAAERIVSAESLDEVRGFLSRAEPGDAVLIKGSRALELERALEAVR